MVWAAGNKQVASLLQTYLLGKGVGAFPTIDRIVTSGGIMTLLLPLFGDSVWFKENIGSRMTGRSLGMANVD